MAYISCPECARAVSESAEFCPSCGYPFGDEPKDVKARRRAQRRIARAFRRERTKKLRRAIRLGVLVLLTGAAVAAHMLSAKKESGGKGSGAHHLPFCK